MNNIEIRPSDLKIVQVILKKTLPEESKVWVFGSRAKGTARRASDLDLAIDAHRPLTREESGELFDAFEESDLPYKVDVVDLNNITENFKKIIEAEKKSIL